LAAGGDEGGAEGLGTGANESDAERAAGAAFFAAADVLLTLVVGDEEDEAGVVGFSVDDARLSKESAEEEEEEDVDEADEVEEEVVAAAVTGAGARERGVASFGGEGGRAMSSFTRCRTSGRESSKPPHALLRQPLSGGALASPTPNSGPLVS
jgi:hypothetical protein